MVSLRRIVRLLVLCLAVAAAYAAWQRSRSRGPEPVAEPSWPPFDEPAPRDPVVDPVAALDPLPAPVPAAAVEPEPVGDAPAWAPPVAGACPPGYPVKAKQASRIYHVPGGRFYDRTTPDRCYADPAAAEADGYRASKS